MWLWFGEGGGAEDLSVVFSRISASLMMSLFSCLLPVVYRRYDLSSSSGESSPEPPKRASYRSPPAATASGARGKKPLDSSPGYNSSEEYDGSRRPYVDPEVRRLW